MQELINEVKEVLKDPRRRITELNNLHIKLIGEPVNTRCYDCINDAVFHLNNWLRNNNSEPVKANTSGKGNSGINLYVQTYTSADDIRNAELIKCLRINKESGLFDNVIEVRERRTFKQMFDLTAQYPEHVNVIANSDIYFDETILWTKFIYPDQCMALSRWDYIGDHTAVLFNRKDSQDAWVFNGAVKPNVKGDFNFGVPGCDNRIARELKDAGYTVKNPSKTIHAIHLHESNVRTYDHKTERVSEPYHFIQPHLL